MTRSDFDFDVISGPADPVRQPAPAPKREEKEERAKAEPASPK